MSHCHVMSCHVVSFHVMSQCHVMVCHVALCHSMCRVVTSCYVMSCHVALCHSMCCVVTSCSASGKQFVDIYRSSSVTVQETTACLQRCASLKLFSDDKLSSKCLVNYVRVCCLLVATYDITRHGFVMFTCQHSVCYQPCGLLVHMSLVINWCVLSARK